MRDRPALGKRVPAPRATLAAVTDLNDRQSEPAPDPVTELEEQLKQATVAKLAAEARAKQANAAASAAEKKVKKLESAPPLVERSYAGTMQRPHRKADGLTYRRTTFSIPEAMDRAIDFYVKSSGGQWRNRSEFLKSAAEAFMKAHPLSDEESPVTTYLKAVEGYGDPS